MPDYGKKLTARKKCAEPPALFQPYGSVVCASASDCSTEGSVNAAISAATSPMSFPSADGTSSHAATACGRASSAITLRAGPRIRSPSTTPSEPKTITCGFNASIRSANPRPIHLPATIATCIASGSSRNIDSTSTRIGVSLLQRSGNISAASSTSPAPEANDSHDPLFPKPSGPSSASRQWPISPAVSLAPRRICPLTMNPPPTPVPNVRKIRCLRFGRFLPTPK